jgi:hypothetical protein
MQKRLLHMPMDVLSLVHQQRSTQMQINYRQTDEQIRAEWAGVERRTPITLETAPKAVVKRDHFAFIAVALFVAVAVLTVVVTF